MTKKFAPLRKVMRRISIIVLFARMKILGGTIGYLAPQISQTKKAMIRMMPITKGAMTWVLPQVYYGY